MATGGSSAGGNESAAVPPLAFVVLRVTSGAGVVLLIAGLLYLAWLDQHFAPDALA